MPNQTVSFAVTTKRCLSVNYHGSARVVEVHAYGMSSDGHDIIRVWQVSGGSRSGQTSGWKLMRLDEISGARLLVEIGRAPRPGYKTGDSAMQPIYCQV